MDQNNKETISDRIMENEFKEGEVVCALVNSNLKLVIRRYVDRIYYYKIQEDLTRKEPVCFERELKACI